VGRIGVLGPVTVDGDAGVLPPRERALLAVLAVRRGETVNAETLADAWWGERLPPTWAKAIQGCVVQLRKVLGGGAIETRPHGYCLVVPSDEVDAHQFARLMARARELLTLGEPDRAAYVVDEALGLWRGRALVDVEEWEPGRVEAQRLEELRRDAEELRVDAALRSGRYQDVLAEAQTRVAEVPLREHRWVQLALAQYQAGRQGDALRTLRQARDVLVRELGLDPGPEIVTAEQAILRQDPSLIAAQLPEPSAVCPYLGLVPYDVGDTDSFFGREADVSECLRRLGDTWVLAVVGPSGSGKSSLVRAGVAAALERDGRRVVIVTPGARPLDALSALPEAGRVAVLVVDQCEEAVTLCTDAEQRAGFFAALVDHAARAPLVVALRADRLGELSAHPAFARLVERGLFLLKSMDESELRAAIEGPARQAGLLLEPGLVDLLVRDVEGEPGALPLLSHALRQTWLRREGRTLTVAGYQASGGIRGAVAQSAEQLYEKAPAEQRPILRDLMLRLVTPSPEGEPVRSRVPRRAVATDAEHEQLIEQLVAARLLTSDEGVVELAHEALARAWPRLRSWLDDDTEGQRIWRHLSMAAGGWEAMGQPDSELYRGVRLDQAAEWRARAEPALNPTERSFLAASHRRADAERVAARRRRRTLTGVLAGAAALAIALGSIAIVQARRADTERDRALTAEEDAQLEALVNRSLALRSTDRSVAALLAVEAHRRAPGDPRAHSALLGTFTAAPGFVGYRHVPVEGAPLQGALVPGTSEAVIAADGRDLLLFDIDTGEIAERFAPFDSAGVTAPDPTFSTVRVSADGRRVAQLVETEACFDLDVLRATDNEGCGALLVYDVASGELVLGPITPPFGPGDVAINADGSVVAVAGGYDGDVAVYTTSDDEQLAAFDGPPRPDRVELVRDTATVRFGPDGHLYIGSMAGPIRVVDPAELEIVDEIDAPEMALQPMITEDGLIVGNGTDTLYAIDSTTGELRWSVDIAVPGDPEPCGSLAVAESIGRLYCGNPHGVLDERELATGQRTGTRLDPQAGGVYELAVAADGVELVAFGGDSAVISRWRLDGSGPIVRQPRPELGSNGYDPSGELMMVFRGERDTLQDSLAADVVDFAVWDPATDEIVDELDGAVAGVWAGPGILGVLYGDGTGGLYDVRRHTMLDLPPQPPGRIGAAALSPGTTSLWVGRAIETEPRCEFTRLDVETLEADDLVVHLDDCDSTFLPSAMVAETPDGSRLAFARPGPEGLTTDFLDGRTGAPLGQTMLDTFTVNLAVDGAVLVGEYSGRITQYDLDTLEPTGAFPGARGAVERLDVSADGSRLLAGSLNQTVSIYDIATRTRLGDPITTDLPLTGGNGGPALRPDGNAVAVNGLGGLAIWDLDPEHLATAACGVAGRNLTRAEWDTYLGDLGEYRSTCPATA
jgi:DNA-binding SARP family transcriptional activator/WD40 repeat protein/energy-coupling factor transporter ATP-binding protein EcfA2